MTKTKLITYIFIIIVIIAGIGLYVSQKEEKIGNLDGFTQCLADSGAKFYGAYWCTHCQSQKELFGSSKKYLPYIECSTPNGQDQLEICKENGIEGYPTWIFADQSELSGEVSLITLAEKTQCLLP